MSGRVVVCRVALTWVIVCDCFYRVAEAQNSVPSPWASLDIAGPALSGSASASAARAWRSATHHRLWSQRAYFRCLRGSASAGALGTFRLDADGVLFPGRRDVDRNRH